VSSAGEGHVPFHGAEHVSTQTSGHLKKAGRYVGGPRGKGSSD
jgi:hypothetical protein